MLQTRFHYASYRDLAYDCIAELFLQDDDGVPKVLRTYFNGLNVQELDEAEILIHLRRLIVARVNQELFRIFGEIDPSLDAPRATAILRESGRCGTSLVAVTANRAFLLHHIDGLTARETAARSSAVGPPKCARCG